MGRHATVAGRMAASANAKAKLFTKLTREIMVCARSGADANNNAALRAAINKARDNSLPKENIERAIKKGSGELKGTQFEEIVYEGYGPGGSAIMVEVLTDNRNRTNPELRRIFQKNGGTMGEVGSVGWMFKKKGVFTLATDKASEDKLITVALEGGADDIHTEEGISIVYTDVTQFALVREALLNAGFDFQSAGLELIPENTVELSRETATQAQELIEKLEELDDVQNVFHNFVEAP
jgi:YebC/PmpR family DNA-binding regulatory protein